MRALCTVAQAPSPVAFRLFYKWLEPRRNGQAKARLRRWTKEQIHNLPFAHSRGRVVLLSVKFLPFRNNFGGRGFGSSSQLTRSGGAVPSPARINRGWRSNENSVRGFRMGFSIKRKYSPPWLHSEGQAHRRGRLCHTLNQWRVCAACGSPRCATRHPKYSNLVFVLNNYETDFPARFAFSCGMFQRGDGELRSGRE